MARTAVFVIQQLPHIQRLTLNPRLERRGSQNVVEQHRQLKAVFLREEAVNVKHPQLVKRRRLRLHNQLAQVQVISLAPGVFKNVRQQNMFPRPHRVNIFQPRQPQNRRYRPRNLLPQQFAVVVPRDIGVSQ